MGEIKQTNFRINNETADRFRNFCEESGMSQAQGFDHIMQIIELNKAKEIIPGRVVEIEEFERYTKVLISSYIKSLAIAVDTEERVLEQFRSKLASKDEQIIKLQEELRNKERFIENANAAVQDAESRQRKAEADLEIMEEKMLAAVRTSQDKTSISEMLQSKLTEAETKLEEYPELKNRLVNALQEIKDIKREAEIAMERAVATVQAELFGLKAAAEEKDKHIIKLELKNDELQANIAELRVKCMTMELQIE